MAAGKQDGGRPAAAGGPDYLAMGGDSVQKEPPGIDIGMTLVLLFAFGASVAFFIFLFTELGYGATLFKVLAKSTSASYFAGCGISLLLLLYVFDVSYWTRDAYEADALADALNQPVGEVRRQTPGFAEWLQALGAPEREALERNWGPSLPPPARRHLIESGLFGATEASAGGGGNSFWRALRAALVCAGVCGVVLGALLLFKSSPYMPLSIWAILVPLFIGLIKSVIYPDTSMAEFLLPLGFACTSAALIWLLTAAAWVGTEDLLWSDETRCDFAARLRDCVDSRGPWDSREAAVRAAFGDDCYPQVNVSLFDGPFAALCANRSELKASNCSGYCWRYGKNGRACLPGCEEDPEDTACTLGDPHCLAAFLLWGAQFMLSLSMLLFGMLVLFIGRVLSTGDQASKLRVIVYVFITMLMVMWVAASIAGASMELSQVLQALAGIGFILTAVIVGASLGWSSLREQAKKNPLIKKMADIANSEAVKGLVVLLIWPILCFFFLLSWLNQKARVHLPFTKRLGPGEDRLTFTKHGSRIEGAMRQWHWANVHRYLILWGVAHFVLRIGAGKLVVLFLSWLNKRLANAGLPLVTLIYILVGLGMFLLPPVPGIPVYLTGGILLGKIGEDELGSFGAAIVYAVFVTLLLKFMAIACQQKLIGERMSENLKVKSFVGINSMQIRAIRRILSQPGMSKDKVAILVGGPDWPTSVLTGILRLQLLQMLLGSCPILLPLGLTVMAGACMLQTSKGALWGALTSIFQVLASMAQLFCTFAAVAAIERTAHECKQEIMPPPEGQGPPDDADVKRLDDDQELFGAALRIATRWTRIPTMWRSVLLAASGTAAASFMLFFFRASGESAEGMFCFETVEVTTDIDEAPLYGNWLKLVIWPLGWLGLALLVLSFILYKFFRCWSVNQARELQVELNKLCEMRCSSVKVSGTHGCIEQECHIERNMDVPKEGIDYYVDVYMRLNGKQTDSTVSDSLGPEVQATMKSQPEEWVNTSRSVRFDGSTQQQQAAATNDSGARLATPVLPPSAGNSSIRSTAGRGRPTALMPPTARTAGGSPPGSPGPRSPHSTASAGRRPSTRATDSPRGPPAGVSAFAAHCGGDSGSLMIGDHVRSHNRRRIGDHVSREELGFSLTLPSSQQSQPLQPHWQSQQRSDWARGGEPVPSSPRSVGPQLRVRPSDGGAPPAGGRRRVASREGGSAFDLDSAAQPPQRGSGLSSQRHYHSRAAAPQRAVRPGSANAAGENSIVWDPPGGSPLAASAHYDSRGSARVPQPLPRTAYTAFEDDRTGAPSGDFIGSLVQR
eukprot:TRINITY_DN15827_c0_g1_i2.p1 TRINITY_DN15827_c0_g1~~TRINITY_DN15827_c0_g1_i2.p1  ORF type:complete len:1302 (+),score=384.34 TRINITY_DN15827_c0_g1_i2:132-4037(+)